MLLPGLRRASESSNAKGSLSHLSYRKIAERKTKAPLPLNSRSLLSLLPHPPDLPNMLTTLKRFWRAYVVGPELTPAQLSAAKDVVEVSSSARQPLPIADSLPPKPQNLISSSPVAVFSKSYCPYCTRAKKLLSSLGQEGKTQVRSLKAGGGGGGAD